MPKDALTEDEQQAVVRAIEAAEQNTSGEIQVHLESHCQGDVMDRAAAVFAILDMHKTRLRNGVLFYLALEDHRFAILGDVGINQKVPDGFWDNIKEHMVDHFQEGRIGKGLEEGILMAGEQLRQHFPYDPEGDINELPDDISFGR